MDMISEELKKMSKEELLELLDENIKRDLYGLKVNRRLTDNELQEIKGRSEKATEGPWGISSQSSSRLNNIRTVGGTLTAQTTDKNNALFISNARQDIPKLLTEIERLKTKELEYRQVLVRSKWDAKLDISIKQDIFNVLYGGGN